MKPRKHYNLGTKKFFVPAQEVNNRNRGDGSIDGSSRPRCRCLAAFSIDSQGTRSLPAYITAEKAGRRVAVGTAKTSRTRALGPLVKPQRCSHVFRVTWRACVQRREESTRVEPLELVSSRSIKFRLPSLAVSITRTINKRFLSFVCR